MLCSHILVGDSARLDYLYAMSKVFRDQVWVAGMILRRA